MSSTPAAEHARELLALATAAGFRLLVVDARELLAAARQERTALRYRRSKVPPSP